MAITLVKTGEAAPHFYRATKPARCQLTPGRRNSPGNASRRIGPAGVGGPAGRSIQATAREVESARTWCRWRVSLTERSCREFLSAGDPVVGHFALRPDRFPRVSRINRISAQGAEPRTTEMNHRDTESTEGQVSILPFLCDLCVSVVQKPRQFSPLSSFSKLPLWNQPISLLSNRRCRHAILPRHFCAAEPDLLLSVPSR
jgi:hypothetical protein